MAPKTDISYRNNKHEWPEGKWPQDGDPPDEERCRYLTGPQGRHCGLPRYASEGHTARCIFHYEGERDPGELREELEAAVKRGAQLRGAKLQKAMLVPANLQKAYLEEADLQKAVLAGANLQKGNLSWAKLQKADLRGAKLQKAHLRGAKLQNAHLLEADLENANLVGAELQNADLRLAKLSGKVDLRSANLTNADLLYVEISPHAKLDGVTWWGDEDKRLKCERDASAPPESPAGDFRACEAVYRQIKHSYQESGDYQTAGQFFIREMECQRRRLLLEAREPTAEARESLRHLMRERRRRRDKAREIARVREGPVRIDPCEWWDHIRPKDTIWRHWWHWIQPRDPLKRGFRWVMWKTCRYGEEPLQVLRIMVVLVLVFAVLHAGVGFNQAVHDRALVGVDQGTHDGRTPVFSPWFVVGEDVSVGWAMWKAVYFSIVNFTSLGHGDLQPTDAGSVVCSIEVVLGAFFIALFMVCVARRFSR